MRFRFSRVFPTTFEATFILAIISAIVCAHPGWRQIGPEGGTFGWVVTDPSNSNIVYTAAGGSIWKSTDAGLHWANSSKDLNCYGMAMFAIDPARPNDLYAATAEGVFASRDAGATWRLTADSSSHSTLYGITVDPQNLGIVYAATYDGIRKSTDRGANWSTVSAEGAVNGARVIVVDPDQPNTIYVNCDIGLKKSTDGGATWAPINTGLTTTDVTEFALEGQTLYAGTGAGIFKSTNGGGNWAVVYSQGDFGNTRSIAIHPGDPQIVYAGNLRGDVAKTTDGGTTWTVAECGPARNHVGHLAIHQQNPQTIYASGLEGFYVSTDGGGTWNPRQTGLKGMDIESIALDDQNPLVYWAGTDYQGLWKTTDGGLNWSKLSLQMYSSPIYSLAKVPGVNTLYASVWEQGLHKSTDGGGSWHRIGDEELLPRYITQVVLSPVTSRLFVAGEGEIKYSDNGGDTWKAGTGLPDWASLYLAFDPVDGQVVYAGSYEEGMFKTTNGGDTWTEIGSFQNQRIRAMLVDPWDANVVYAGTDGYLNRSTDKGATWVGANIPGLTHGSVKTFATGPAKTVFAATWSGRLFKTQDRGESWSEVLPRAPVTVAVQAIASNSVDGSLLIGTDGAGLFKGEYNAERTVYFPQIADGAAGSLRFRTTVVLVNGGEATEATITFKNSLGAPLALSLNGSAAKSVHTVSLGARQSVSLQTPGTGDLHVGYATLTSGSQVGGTAVFTLYNNSVAMYEAGVPAAQPMYDCSILFDRSEPGRDVGVAVVSAADAEDANITFRLFNESNELVLTRAITAILPKFGPGYHIAKYATEIFPEIRTLGLTRGVMTVDSDQPIAPVTLRQTDNALVEFPQEVPTMCVFPVIDRRAESTFRGGYNGYVYFPQIANGRLGNVSLDTTLVLLNTGRTTNVTIEFYGADGALSLPLRDLGARSSIELTLERGRTYQIRTTGEGDVQAGFARVYGPLDLGGTAVFTYTDNGMRLFEAGVPAAIPLRRQAIYMDKSQTSRDIGFAAINPSGSASSAVTLRLYNNQGELKATKSLAGFADPLDHLAKYATELFAEIGQQNITGGIITVESDQPLSAVTLRQHSATQAFPNDFYLMTIFPVISMLP